MLLGWLSTAAARAWARPVKASCRLSDRAMTIRRGVAGEARRTRGSRGRGARATADAAENASPVTQPLHGRAMSRRWARARARPGTPRGGARTMGFRPMGFAMDQAGFLEAEARPARAATAGAAPVAAPLVAHFRQTFLWPIYLLPIKADTQVQDHCAYLLQSVTGSPWQEVADEFTGEPDQFQERHYNEFVTFLPPVQRDRKSTRLNSS